MRSCPSDEEVVSFPVLLCRGYRVGGLRKNLQGINDFILFEQNFVMEKTDQYSLICMLLDPVVGVEQLFCGLTCHVLQS